MCVLLCLLRHQYINIAGLGGNSNCCLVLRVFRVLIKCRELATATQLVCPSSILLNVGSHCKQNVYCSGDQRSSVCMHIRLTVQYVLKCFLNKGDIYLRFVGRVA